MPPVSPVDMHQDCHEEQPSPNESLPDIRYPVPPKRVKLTNQKEQKHVSILFVYCTIFQQYLN